MSAVLVLSCDDYISQIEAAQPNVASGRIQKSLTYKPAPQTLLPRRCTTTVCAAFQVTNCFKEGWKAVYL